MKKSPRVFRCPYIKRVDKHDVKRQSIKGLIAATLIFVFVVGFAQSATAATITTRRVTETVTYSQLTITLARHTAITTFSFGGGRLTNPRAVDNDWWTAPLHTVLGHSARWDWYNTAPGGNGRSNTWVRFKFGVPTAWGPIGSEMTSRHFLRVFWNGCFG